MKVKKIAFAALFAALAYVAMFATSWIKVMFLTFDAKDAVIALAGLIFGPIYSLVISLAVAVIELITVGDTGFYGFFMNLLSSAVFSTVCALIYKYKKNFVGAIVGLACSVLAVTATMMLFNLIITPLYMNVERSVVASMIPTLFLPFNLTKASLNSALVLILYKPVSTALKAARVLPSGSVARSIGEDASKKKKRILFSLAITLIGIIITVICLLVFFLVLEGEFVPFWE
jgi:riboflavin transporter FmnP